MTIPFNILNKNVPIHLWRITKSIAYW